MAPKLPWFPFYGRDFFEDEKVKQMSHEQVGMYLRLLQHQWIEGSVSESVALSFCSNVGKKATIERANIRAVLAHCFTVLSPDPQRLMNPRLERIRAEQLEKEAKHHEKSVKGGQQRQAQARAQALAQPPLSHSESEAESEEDKIRNCISLNNGGAIKSEPDALDEFIRKGFEPVDPLARKPRPRSAIDLLDCGPSG